MLPEELLICRIIEQAIVDYNFLLKKGVQKYTDSSASTYSIKEIKTFFGSGWCEFLLDIIDSEFTGAEILDKAGEYQRTGVYV